MTEAPTTVVLQEAIRAEPREEPKFPRVVLKPSLAFLNKFYRSQTIDRTIFNMALQALRVGERRRKPFRHLPWVHLFLRRKSS